MSETNRAILCEMKLPYYESSQIKPEKITAYLLSESHPSGRHKAKFFTSFGFAPNNWQQLSQALPKHAQQHNVASVESSPFGVRYVVEGNIQSPDKRNPFIRAVWFIEKNSTMPYFVTAYSVEGK